jgi:hypothetical protein
MADKSSNGETATHHLRASKGEQERTGVNTAATVHKTFSRRLNRKRTAEYLAVSLSWLDKARLTGLGPVFITIGGRIVYDSADLDAFLQSNRRTSTSEQY